MVGTVADQNYAPARNVVFLTLLIDDAESRKCDALWNIYYHPCIDQDHLGVVQAQAKKLYSLSSSMAAWHEGEYGRDIRFCDSRTLSKVAEIWSFYSAENKEEGRSLVEATPERTFESSIRRAKKQKADAGHSFVVTGLRSATPVVFAEADDVDGLNNIHQHYWRYGNTDLGPQDTPRVVYANPTFATPDRNVTFHYGSDPILGFHISTAYAPLAPGSPLSRPSDGLSRPQGVVAAARAEFRAWIDSFRRRLSGSLILRVFAGDAIAFSHALQCQRVDKVPDSSHWYRDRHHFEPLTIDGEDYSLEGSAPLAFNVIDTSNVADHVGPLNLLIAASPLLQDDMSASLYTEALVKRTKSHQDLSDNLLCGHLPTCGSSSWTSSR